MCTVIYLPAPDGPLFASCRDEDPARPAAEVPKITQGKTGLLAFPAVASGRGTWIGLHEKGHTLILLNGAFKKHKRALTYRKSRGLIVTTLLDTLDPVKEWKAIDLDDIEPFTLIAWCNQQLMQLSWDGRERFTQWLPEFEPRIWSSSTLYNSSVQKTRTGWFNAAIKKKAICTKAQLLQLLLAHNDPRNGFVMKRENVQTLSITFIQLYEEYALLSYRDLHNSTVCNLWLKQTGMFNSV